MMKEYIHEGHRLCYDLVQGGETPLVLIHGQCMCSLDYENVIDELRRKYTMYIVDCFGHGESEKDASLYACRVIGDAIAGLIRDEIGKKCIISGHSSGGILAAYVAGKVPELVRGAVLEDPPFFNVEPGEFENTFVYRDGFRVTHEFLNQNEEDEYLVYYIENGYMFNYLGERFFGKDWAHELAMEAKEKLKREPGRIPVLDKVPEKSFHGLRYMEHFDMAFAESFYDGSWFDGVSQEEILKAVKCPSVYLKAKTKHGKDGVLWAANSEESAAKVMRLLPDARRKEVRSGHDIHYEKPKSFLKAFNILEKMIV